MKRAENKTTDPILNLFYSGFGLFRQNSSVSPGPIFLSVNGPPENNVDQCVADALNRYKTLNNADINYTPAEMLLSTLRGISGVKILRITFYEDGAKIRIRFARTDFIIDFDFEEPDSVFITTFKNGTMVIKDCKIGDLQETLELF
jgi:hypothetical protein